MEMERADSEKKKATKNLPAVVKAMLVVGARWLWCLMEMSCSDDD
jgi:hypothetical protein